jgi:hypothetical protein
MPRNLLTKAALAAHPKIRVSTRSISNWHAAGFVRAYTVPGKRTLLFDLDEVLAEIDRNPSMRPPSKMHGAVVPLREPVRIVDVPRKAVVVEP